MDLTFFRVNLRKFQFNLISYILNLILLVGRIQRWKSGVEKLSGRFSVSVLHCVAGYGETAGHARECVTAMVRDFGIGKLNIDTDIFIYSVCSITENKKVLTRNYFLGRGHSGLPPSICYRDINPSRINFIHFSEFHVSGHDWMRECDPGKNGKSGRRERASEIKVAF